MLFGAIVFVVLCIGLGGASAFFAWLMLRRRPRVRLMMTVAGVLPAVCGIYMVVCLILFSGGNWGDIDEPLPHGYTLTALGKMPDAAFIEASSGDHAMKPEMQSRIGAVDLEGDMLFGQYNDGFGDEFNPATVKLKWCCFAFNTATGEVKNFISPDEMNNFAGKTIATEEVQYFHSREPGTIRTRRLQKWILLTPPAVTVLLLLGLLLWWRMTTSPEPA